MEEEESFYNVAKKLEELYASTVLRFPIPRPEAIKDGLYGIFKYDVLYAGTGDLMLEHGRRMREILNWEYTHDVEEACPYRVFNAMTREGSEDWGLADDGDPWFMHPYRPYEVLMPEHTGLRLAKTEGERASLEGFIQDGFAPKDVLDWFNPPELEDRDLQEYTLAWMRAVLWQLSNIWYQYMAEQQFGADDRDQPSLVVVLNCDDMSLSVRLVCVGLGGALQQGDRLATHHNTVPSCCILGGGRTNPALQHVPGQHRGAGEGAATPARGTARGATLYPLIRRSLRSASPTTFSIPPRRLFSRFRAGQP